MQVLDLDLDKENELIFKLSIEGIKSATVSSRFLIETEDFSLVFKSQKLSSAGVTVLIPPLENIIGEGVYQSSLEVLVDDKVFIPVSVETSFEKSIKVVSESVSRKKPETQVTISEPVVVSTPKESVVEKKEPVVETIPIPNKTSASKEVTPSLEYKVIEESLEVEHKTARPPQRTRTRPASLGRLRSHIPAAQDIQDKLTESRIEKIKEIAARKNITLTDEKIKQILKITKDKKSGGK